MMEVVAATGDTCLGLLTLVLLFANSSRMVWGKSGSKRTPCCKRPDRERETREQCSSELQVTRESVDGQGGLLTFQFIFLLQYMQPFQKNHHFSDRNDLDL